MAKKYPPVSFYPAPGKTPARVVACIARADGLYDVTVEHSGTRCVYLGSRVRYAIGDDPAAAIRTRLNKIIPRRWSPFDGVDDD